ncbi:MAG TPA: TVP38/TMEM64 family protein [Hyphomonadaceae bacterium]|nr:TVP38/TMEM64 family protein [Hyphomonadaceae bacterium]
MKKLLAFLNNMDSRAWRTVWVSLALLAGVALLIVLGKSDLLGLATTIEPWLATLHDNGWAFPATILVFVATSFVGAPAIMLNAACVLAFGPVMGSIYAMAGTVASCTVHFWIGRWRGPELMHRYGGDTVNRMARFIGKNDFMASAIVRSVPTAPPIVVNLAFGAARANYWRFIAGAAVGSVPKIAVVAIFGEAIAQAFNGGVMVAALIGFAVISAWLTFSLMARKAVRGEKDGEAANGDAGSAGSERAGGDAEPRKDVGGDAGGSRHPVAGRASEDRP